MKAESSDVEEIIDMGSFEKGLRVGLCGRMRSERNKLLALAGVFAFGVVHRFYGDKQKKSKGRFERLQKLPEAAKELLNEKVAELEEVAREERNTIFAGITLFVIGVAVGALIARKKGE